MNKAIPTFWYRSSNFGDQLAPYLVEKISGEQPVYTDPSSGIEHLALVGSILEACGKDTAVWGAGYAYGNRKEFKAIHALRGGCSAELHQFDGPLGDPALLLPRFFNPTSEKKYRAGIIPHLVDQKACLYRYANIYTETRIIDLSLPVEDVIVQILECEMTICSALHGLIVSHAYGIPSVCVRWSNEILGFPFKFEDYRTTVDYPEIVDLTGMKNLWPIMHEAEKGIIKTNLDKLLESCPILP